MTLVSVANCLTVAQIDDDDDFEEIDPIQQKKTGGSVYSSYFAPTPKGYGIF